MRPTIILAALLLLAGCNIQDTAPQTQIDRLRVLSVRIEGPAGPDGRNYAELAPGDTATLTPLVLAPGIGPADGISRFDDMTAAQDVCLEDYGQLSWERNGSTCASGSAKARVYRFWAWCPPQAATLFYDPCTDTSVLNSPEQVFGTEGIQPLGQTCPPPSSGSAPMPAETACVQPNADLFASSDDLVRRRGVLMSVLLVTVIDVDGDYAPDHPERLPRLLQKIQAKTVPVVVSLKRVPVLEHPANHNPVPTAVSGGSGVIVEGATLGQEKHLTVSADPPESYGQVNPDGTVTARAEQLDVAWFSGFGRFDSAHTLLGETNIYTPATGAGIDLPPPGTGDYPMPFAIVVRDGRGGEGWWIVRDVLVPRP